MGWQGEVRRRGELERVARDFGVSWQEIRVWCWRSNDKYWVEVQGRPAQQVPRKELIGESLRRASHSAGRGR